MKTTLAELAKKLRALSQMIQNQDFTPAIDAASQAMYNDALYCFENESNPDGTPWPPLKYRSGQTLILTGQLESGVVASFANPTTTNNSIRVEFLGPEYGIFHQEGTDKIPQRVFFGLAPSTITKVYEAIADAMLSELKDQL